MFSLTFLILIAMILLTKVSSHCNENEVLVLCGGKVGKKFFVRKEDYKKGKIGRGCGSAFKGIRCGREEEYVPVILHNSLGQFSKYHQGLVTYD